MSKIVYCEFIIKDDFNNVLVVKKKVKGETERKWELIGGGMRNRAKFINSEEKEELDDALFTIMHTNFRTIGFDVTEFATEPYKMEGFEDLEVYKKIYVAVLRDKAMFKKEILGKEWISSKDLDKFDFKGNERKILEQFWGI
ncbi:MAG: hypothetical protein ACRC41_06250 [Sarcina sp.]